MPKRVIDGEAIYGSHKLSRVEPSWVRPEFANLIPLALANGVFDANPRLVWTKVYSFNRPEITVEKVEAILDSLEKARLLFRWSTPDGKVWGFWIGIEKPGRLPKKSHRNRYTNGPDPPKDKLQKFLQSPFTPTLLPFDSPQTPGTSGSASLMGLGLGSGLGSQVSMYSSAAAREPAAAASPSGLIFQNEFLTVSKEDHTELQRLFPDFELLTVYEQIAAAVRSEGKSPIQKTVKYVIAWMHHVPPGSNGKHRPSGDVAPGPRGHVSPAALKRISEREGKRK
jgi:hypothetical protein